MPHPHGFLLILLLLLNCAAQPAAAARRGLGAHHHEGQTTPSSSPAQHTRGNFKASGQASCFPGNSAFGHSQRDARWWASPPAGGVAGRCFLNERAFAVSLDGVNASAFHTANATAALAAVAGDNATRAVSFVDFVLHVPLNLSLSTPLPAAHLSRWAFWPTEEDTDGLFVLPDSELMVKLRISGVNASDHDGGSNAVATLSGFSALNDDIDTAAAAAVAALVESLTVGSAWSASAGGDDDATSAADSLVVTGAVNVSAVFVVRAATAADASDALLSLTSAARAEPSALQAALARGGAACTAFSFLQNTRAAVRLLLPAGDVATSAAAVNTTELEAALARGAAATGGVTVSVVTTAAFKLYVTSDAAAPLDDDTIQAAVVSGVATALGVPASAVSVVGVLSGASYDNGTATTVVAVNVTSDGADASSSSSSSDAAVSSSNVTEAAVSAAVSPAVTAALLSAGADAATTRVSEPTAVRTQTQLAVVLGGEDVSGAPLVADAVQQRSASPVPPSSGAEKALGAGMALVAVVMVATWTM